MQTSSRQPWLDWLRVFAIIGVLLFHSAMAFVSEWGWHLKNADTSNLLLEFNFWLSRFRMPLLFFISGAVTYFMIRSRSACNFIGLRFKRLFIPLLFGIFVVVPPQIYMERLTQGVPGNYLDFYPSVFEFKPYPFGGSFSWHHLWFILYLFLYNLVFAPLFRWVSSEKGRGFRERLSWLGGGKRIYLLMLPGTIVFAALIQRFPQTNDLIHDWCYLIYWLMFVLGGFICMANANCMNSLERNRRMSFTIAFLSIVFINYLRWNDLEPENGQSWQQYGYLSLYGVTAWTWVMTAIGYGRRYLNKENRILHYANEAVYPFYILHQTVIVILVYYVIQVEESIGMKYLFTVLLSFGVSMIIYHLFIRPSRVVGFLFGMSPAKRGKQDVIAREARHRDHEHVIANEVKPVIASGAKQTKP